MVKRKQHIGIFLHNEMAISVAGISPMCGRSSMPRQKIFFLRSIAWAAEQAKAFQRASSAVEGRNGYLSQLHHNQRGLPKHRYKVWTVLHNFDCRASDGTTPAARFFRRGFPDLFETVLSNVGDLPRPRQRNPIIALSG